MGCKFLQTRRNSRNAKRIGNQQAYAVRMQNREKFNKGKNRFNQEQMLLNIHSWF